MDKRCEYCGGTMVTVRVDARFCTQKCGVYSRRKLAKMHRFPAEMTSKERFVRAKGKVPLQLSGRNASSTNPSTWATFGEVASSKLGDGFGVMLGDGLGCYDFDSCIVDGVPSEAVRARVAEIPERILFVERSMSGKGLHVFVGADEGPGITRPGFERYTRARFIRLTRDMFALEPNRS